MPPQSFERVPQHCPATGAEHPESPRAGDVHRPQSLSLPQPGRGGLSWSGEGRGCNTLTGSFTIASVTYVDNVLQAIDLTFEQHCEGGTPALHGSIQRDSRDQTRPPDPVFPVPDGLWQPAPGTTPPIGNFVYLNSDVGD